MTSIIINGNDVQMSESGPARSVTLQDTVEKPGLQKDLQDHMKWGSHSVTALGNGMQVTQNGPTRIEPATSGVLPGILASAKTPYGHVINDMGQIKPDSRIEYGGTQLEVKTAIAMGLLARAADGTFYDPNAQSQGEVQSQGNQESQGKQEGEVVTIDFMDKEQRGTMAEFKARVGTEATDQYFAQAFAKALRGENIDLLVEDFAQATQATPDSVHNFTQEVLNRIFDSGLGYLKARYKVDPQDVLRYVTDKTSNNYRINLLLGLYHNNLRVADELMKNYRNQERV